MATYNKFQDFVEQLGLGTHNLNTDTLKVMLTNTAPVATNTVKTDITEISAGNVTLQVVMILPTPTQSQAAQLP